MLDRHMRNGHNREVVEVVGSIEFEEWFQGLGDQDADAVARIVDMLEMYGTELPFPYSSAIKGAKLALRELRVQSQGKPLRILYAFDPIRRAALLVGGDKTGDGRFYERMVPLAEKIWGRYLKEIGQ